MLVVEHYMSPTSNDRIMFHGPEHLNLTWDDLGRAHLQQRAVMRAQIVPVAASGEVERRDRPGGRGSGRSRPQAALPLVRGTGRGALLADPKRIGVADRSPFCCCSRPGQAICLHTTVGHGDHALAVVVPEWRTGDHLMGSAGRISQATIAGLFEDVLKPWQYESVDLDHDPILCRRRRNGVLDHFIMTWELTPLEDWTIM